MVQIKAHVLVVDDDKSFRRTVVRQLTGAGYPVLEASNMIEAMAQLEGSLSIDLMLTDLNLSPGKPHGFSIARVVKMKYPDIRIVFMTGGDADAYAMHRETDTVVAKPFRREQLLEVIERVMAAPS